MRIYWIVIPMLRPCLGKGGPPLGIPLTRVGDSFSHLPRHPSDTHTRSHVMVIELDLATIIYFIS
mgnify:CR=1 FL=1